MRCESTGTGRRTRTSPWARARPASATRRGSTHPASSATGSKLIRKSHRLPLLLLILWKKGCLERKRTHLKRDNERKRKGKTSEGFLLHLSSQLSMNSSISMNFSGLSMFYKDIRISVIWKFKVIQGEGGNLTNFRNPENLHMSSDSWCNVT